VDDIARLCGYLPLALRLAANALANRVSLTPLDYLHQLTKDQERLKLIDASINLSYRMLSPEMQKLWRALSVFQETFAISMAAELWELELDVAQSALDEMTSYSLVEWDENFRLYRLHDLVRVFASAQLSEGERETAWKRRTTRLAKESFRQQREKIVEGYDPREREAILYLNWLRKKTYRAYTERAKKDNRKFHPAIQGLENVAESFTELLGYYRNYVNFIRTNTATSWQEFKKLETKIEKGVADNELSLDTEKRVLNEIISKHGATISKLRILEATLMLTENYFALIGDLMLGLDTNCNIDRFEREFESGLELTLTAIALAKDSIQEDYK
jgi:hypothetical protein